MRKRDLILFLVLATLAAMVAVWFWALPPLLTPLFYLHPTDWTDADVVRHIWHFRLVQPEWVSTPPDYMRWSRAETLARLVVVFIAWLSTTTLCVRGYLRGHTNPSPNKGIARMKTGLIYPCNSQSVV
jgi:hypothetical protein